MPFCGNCGSQVADAATFCPSCGRQQNATVAPPAPAAGPAPAKGGSAMKFVLIIVGALFFMGFLAFAVVGYIGYKAVKTVQKGAEDRGIDFTAMTSGEKGRSYDPCSLLTAQEAGEILSRTVTRAERQGDSCDYYIKPPTEEERKAEIARNADTVSETKQADSQEMDRDPNAAMRKQGMEELVKSITGGTNDGTTPYLQISVHEEGKMLINATKVAIGMGGGANMLEPLKGVADEAVMGPMDSTLTLVKKGTGVQIDLRQVGRGRERGIAMAKLIAARM